MSDSDTSDEDVPKSYLANLDTSAMRSETAAARKKELIEYVDHLKMQGHHALSAEIDRTLKKVNEGVEEVIAAFEALETTTDPNVKEKFAEILKKEVRKLQKHRDGLGPWINSNKFKEKKLLHEHRALIERQMSRWKYLEKRVKVKEYSEIGLNRPNAKPVNRIEKDRDDLRNWLVNVIDKLKQLTDLIELDIDQLLDKKGKKSWKEFDLQKLKTMKQRNEFHLDKFEALLRMLHNMTVESDEIIDFMGQVKKIKDDIEYYLEAWREPDFEENEFLYDDIVGIEENKISQSPSSLLSSTLPSPLPVSTTPSKAPQNITGGTSSGAVPVKATKSTSKTLIPALLNDIQPDTPVEHQEVLSITNVVPEVSSWPHLQARKPLDNFTRTETQTSAIPMADKEVLPNPWAQNDAINRISQLKETQMTKIGLLQQVKSPRPLPINTVSSPPPGFFDRRVKINQTALPVPLPTPPLMSLKLPQRDNSVWGNGSGEATKSVAKVSIPASLTDPKPQTPWLNRQLGLNTTNSVSESWPDLLAGKPSENLARTKAQIVTPEPPGFRRPLMLSIGNSLSEVQTLPTLTQDNAGKRLDNHISTEAQPCLAEKTKVQLAPERSPKEVMPRSIPYQFKGTPTATPIPRLHTSIATPREVRRPSSLPTSFLDSSPPPGFCPRVRIPKLDFIGTYVVPTRPTSISNQRRMRLGLRQYDDIYKRMDGEKPSAQKNQKSSEPSKLEFSPELLRPDGGLKTVGEHVKEFLDTFFRSNEVLATGILPNINSQSEFDAYIKSLTGYYAPDFFPDYWPS